jgi:hypothetical protein
MKNIKWKMENSCDRSRKEYDGERERTPIY